MKIAYYADHRQKHSDDTEGHITRAFEELGHEVIRVQEGQQVPDNDFTLFHKKIPNTKKTVCWYFDKVYAGRENYMEAVKQKADAVFVTDETWALQQTGVHVLRQGVGDPSIGNKVEASDIAFVGSVYGARHVWVKGLMERFTNFRVYNNKFNKDLNDLCASVKIFVAPNYPSNDYYWSNRVYLIAGSGGFLIHPYLEGLYEEFGDKLEYYRTENELYDKIRYYLEHENERIQKQKKLYKFAKNITYKSRCETMLSVLKNTGIIE